MTRSSASPLCCPNCGHPIGVPPDNNAGIDPVSAMRAACSVLGIAVSWDGWVSEVAAAKLLRRAPSTLRNRRSLDQPLAFRKLGRRIEYSLTELCRWSQEIED